MDDLLTLFKDIKKKESIGITIAFCVLLIGMIFSIISPLSIFNGSNSISILLFFGSMAFFIYSIIRLSIKYNLNKVKFEYLLLLSFFILCLFTVRGAIRLTMILASVSTIFVGYLIVECIYASKKHFKNKEIKSGTSIIKPISFGILAIVILSSCFTGYTYYNTSTTNSYNFVPNYYNIQWQKAMDWTRNNTPVDSVFASWWDYGYWIQALGERATITDGGNVIAYWNYLMGRHVLTSDNQEDALEFLYNHNANYLLIDSSDIGKYGAYSSIASNEEHERFSTVPTLLLDLEQTRETNNVTSFFYKGGMNIDEDIIYAGNGTEYFFPQSQSAIYGIVVEIRNDNTINKIDIIIFNKGTITSIPLRYGEYNGAYYDFGKGINGTIKIIPRIDGSNAVYTNGALLYLSPRVTKTLFSNLYLLNDPTNKFPNFKISYVEPDILSNKNDIFFYDPIGIIGPIKIWSINYSGNEQLREEYIDIDPDKYLDWKL